MTTLEDTTRLLKALADPSRLRIIHSLLDRPSHYVEELAERLGLQPSTVSHHLKKLEQAELVTKRKDQYYMLYRVREDRLDTWLRDLVETACDQQSVEERRLARYRQKVLRSFFRDGRLQQLPAQRKKRLIVLAALAADFAPDRDYAETEINETIVRRFADYCTVRRELVDFGLLRRDSASGGAMVYRRSGELEVDALPAPQEDTAPANGDLETRRRRADLYRQTSRRAGIYAVRNKQTGRLLLGSSLNLHGPLNRHLTELRIGSHRCRALQEDWKRLGEDAFVFEVLDHVDEALTGPEREAALRELEQRWIKDLRPLSDRCYNGNERIRTTAF